MTLVDPIKSGLFGKKPLSCKCKDIAQPFLPTVMDTKNLHTARPRTKRLERPTPNLKHPVIEVTNKKAVVDRRKLKNNKTNNLSPTEQPCPQLPTTESPLFKSRSLAKLDVRQASMQSLKQTSPTQKSTDEKISPPKFFDDTWTTNSNKYFSRRKVLDKITPATTKSLPASREGPTIRDTEQKISKKLEKSVTLPTTLADELLSAQVIASAMFKFI